MAEVLVVPVSLADVEDGAQEVRQESRDPSVLEALEDLLRRSALVEEADLTGLHLPPGCVVLDSGDYDGDGLADACDCSPDDGTARDPADVAGVTVEASSRRSCALRPRPRVSFVRSRPRFLLLAP